MTPGRSEWRCQTVTRMAQHKSGVTLMLEEQLKAFLAKAKDDQSIQDKLKAAKTPEDVVDIAKEHGHEFTADKIT